MIFDEERLMRYFDGDLAAEEAREMERMLADSPEARALLRDFETVGSEIRAIAEEQGTRAGAIVDRVMANLEPLPAKPEPGPGGRVIRFAPVVGVALAAAAAVALFIRWPSSPPVALVPASVAESASVAADPAASESAAPMEMAAADTDDSDPGASIESVDFGAENGTIFMVGSGSQMTPVVWLVDDSAPSGGRMAPL